MIHTQLKGYTAIRSNRVRNYLYTLGLKGIKKLDPAGDDGYVMLYSKSTFLQKALIFYSEFRTELCKSKSK